jgi:hypothetical protein
MNIKFLGIHSSIVEADVVIHLCIMGKVFHIDLFLYIYEWNRKSQFVYAQQSSYMEDYCYLWTCNEA